MLKKTKHKKNSEILNLINQSEILEERVNNNINEILKLVESINIKKEKLKNSSELESEEKTATAEDGVFRN